MMSFNYLKELKDIYESQISLKEIVFLLGNTSCDMDSALSSYLLSIGKNLKENILTIDKESNSPSINKNTEKIYLPVLNCKRGTLPYRLDIKYVFDRFGIDEKDFWYITDDIFQEGSLFKYPKNSNIKTNIIILDFNDLTEDQKYLTDYVIEVFDHHQAKKLSFPNLKKITIKYPVGSCTTLVLLEHFMNDFPLSLLSPEFALSAILLDTENFKPSLYSNRWVDLDKFVFENIKSNIVDKTFEMEKYYKDIDAAKFDEKRNLDLGMEALLLKDKKTYDWGKFKVIWSSFTVPYPKINERYGVKEITSHFRRYYGKTQEEEKNTFYFTNCDYGKAQKYFTIYNPSNIPIDTNLLKAELEKHLKKGDIPIRVENIPESEKKGVIYHIIFDKTCSRKVMEPIFKKIFKDK